MSGIHQQGFSNRMIYDNCSYDQYLNDTIGPYQYQLYQGAHENNNKCKYDKFYHPYDLVDVESELKNQTRPATKCGIYKYNNNECGKCVSTNSKPIVIDNIASNSIQNSNINSKPNLAFQQQMAYYGNLQTKQIPNVKSETSKQNTEKNKIETKIENFTQNNGIQTSTVRCSTNGNLSTFDNTIPIVYPPEICPIVYNNIPKRYNNGYTIPNYMNYNCKQ